MISESPTRTSVGRPASAIEAASKTGFKKATCAATSGTTMRGLIEWYPALRTPTVEPTSPTFGVPPIRQRPLRDRTVDKPSSTRNAIARRSMRARR
jgi:hypothetical protein